MSLEGRIQKEAPQIEVPVLDSSSS